jgi:hypothetical protein
MAEAEAGDIVDLGAELERIRTAMARGDHDLRTLGFWSIVGRIKRDRLLVTRYADDVGRIDAEAFRRGIRIRVPVWAGNALLGAGIVAGGGAVVLAGMVPSPFWAGALMVAAGGIWSVAFHSPTHWLVGRLGGIRFTAYFLAGRPIPYPGVKVDYATYLRADPSRRAWMHASGAIATKLAPFLALAFVPAVGAPGWSALALLAMGLVELTTDILISTKHSDWKRFRRERAVARASRSG